MNLRVIVFCSGYLVFCCFSGVLWVFGICLSCQFWGWYKTKFWCFWVCCRGLGLFYLIAVSLGIVVGYFGFWGFWIRRLLFWYYCVIWFCLIMYFVVFCRLLLWYICCIYGLVLFVLLYLRFGDWVGCWFVLYCFLVLYLYFVVVFDCWLFKGGCCFVLVFVSLWVDLVLIVVVAWLDWLFDLRVGGFVWYVAYICILAGGLVLLFWNLCLKCLSVMFCLWFAYGSDLLLPVDLSECWVLWFLVSDFV